MLLENIFPKNRLNNFTEDIMKLKYGFDMIMTFLFKDMFFLGSDIFSVLSKSRWIGYEMICYDLHILNYRGMKIYIMLMK